jgi:hemerythrin-like domain-containing protein
MGKLSERMVDDHNRCDALLLAALSKVGECDWEQASPAFDRFHTALNRHLTMEESVLFPTIEKVLKDGEGLFDLLRAEHARLKLILLRMQDAVRVNGRSNFLLHSDSFAMLMHAHSIKEEEILYLMLECVYHIDEDGTIKATPRPREAVRRETR